MKERPILFSGAMVRAILAGEKTQTRRIVKPQECVEEMPEESELGVIVHAACPYGQPGDRLWVRETWAEVTGPSRDEDPAEFQRLRLGMAYRADWHAAAPFPWRPSIFMRRWMSRITLEVTDVRVERLLDISAADCRAEGHPQRPGCSQEAQDDAARDWYMDLWISINGKGSWNANPFVWVVTFKHLQP